MSFLTFFVHILYRMNDSPGLDHEWQQWNTTLELKRKIDEFYLPNPRLKNEIRNILERWIIASFNDHLVSSESSQIPFPLWHSRNQHDIVLGEDSQFVIKMKQEFTEKNITNYQSLIDKWRDLILTDSLRYLSEVVPQKISSLVRPSENEIIIHTSKSRLKLKKTGPQQFHCCLELQDKKENMHRISLRTSVVEAFVKNAQTNPLLSDKYLADEVLIIAANQLTILALRYEALSCGSQHWGLSPKHAQFVYDTFKVRNIGFASAFNFQLYGQGATTHFCGLFPDIEKNVGCLGRWQDQKWLLHQPLLHGNWFLNPPWIEKAYLLPLMYSLIEQFMEREQNPSCTGNDLIVIVYVPNWVDAQFMTLLTTHPILVKYTVLDLILLKQTYSIMTATGDIIRASMNSRYFVFHLTSDPLSSKQLSPVFVHKLKESLL